MTWPPAAFDMTLQRDITLNPRFPRCGDVFNLFNNVNFGLPNRDLAGGASFGHDLEPGGRRAGDAARGSVDVLIAAPKC